VHLEANQHKTPQGQYLQGKVLVVQAGKQLEAVPLASMQRMVVVVAAPSVAQAEGLSTAAQAEGQPRMAELVKCSEPLAAWAALRQTGVTAGCQGVVAVEHAQARHQAQVETVNASSGESSK